MKTLDLPWVRMQFPALSQHVHDQPAIFFDGPGGTQVPKSVPQFITDYLMTSNANAHGAFLTSQRTDTWIATARSAIADFLGAEPSEIVFGANMTTLTFALSRAIGRELRSGDEIIVTESDHDANVAPWLALQERGVVVRMVRIHPDDCTLDLEELAAMLTERTRLLAIGYASNAVGTINDIAAITAMARARNIWTFVDAVHYAPHGPIDVHELGCDFLICSAYKFFGPHVGILYGKSSLLAQLHPYKVRPAADTVPSRWETGTQNHEGLAGLVGAIEYFTKLGQRLNPTVSHRRDALVTAMAAIHAYEQTLSRHLIDQLSQVNDIEIYGITDRDRLAWRTPTLGIRLGDFTPADVATQLGDRGIFTWHGNFYALNLTRRLGVEDRGGLVRIGLVHYNTVEEIDRTVQAFHEIARGRSLVSLLR